jgi:hypothetical protein
MAGLQRILKSYGRMKVGEQLWVWDYASDEAVKAEEMPLGSQRWKDSERAKWEQIKKKEGSL